MSDPLDRPNWTALTTRQAHLADGDPARAVRLQAPYGLFAGAADASAEGLAALAALCPRDNGLVIIEAGEAAMPPGMRIADTGRVDQMIAEAITPGEPLGAIEPLGDADAAEMLAMATLTRPGPFFERTHQLGDFVGVKVDGRLAAMAGERMRLPGYTEVSAVCVHPDHRGKGYGAALSRHVAERILARGETPMLHVYDHNAPAIAIYEALGFRRRTTLNLTVLAWRR